MEGKILQHAVFFLLCVFFISDITIAEKTSSEAIRGTKKLECQENQTIFSSPTTTTQKDNIPIVNPTTTGTTPIANPTSPPPPPTTGPTTTTPAAAGVSSWCIASPSAAQNALQVALDYACGYGGADCSAIQPNGACYDPNTVRDHASYAFNNYYQKNPIPTSCVFGGTAQLTDTNPSHGNCRYASSSTTTPKNPTPTNPTPPSTIVPANPEGGNAYVSEPTGFGYEVEPTGTPSSAETTQSNLLLIIVIKCLMLLLSMACRS